MVDGEIKALDRSVSQLRSEIEVLKKDRDKLRSELDYMISDEDKIHNLNERVRQAMELISDRFGISLMSLFDPGNNR